MENRVLVDGMCRLVEEEPTSALFEDVVAALTALKKESSMHCSAYSRHLYALMADKAVETAGRDVSEAGKMLAAIERMLLLNAPDDFDLYMLYMEWGREPAKRFWMPRREVLMPVCRGFQDLEDGLVDKLMVSLPPRVGKSTTGVFFITWHMGRNPLHANVMSGHSDKLTKGFHMEALSILRDKDTYRYAEVFPDSPVKEFSMQDETVNLVKRQRFPTLTCRAVGGTLTGAVEVGRKGVLYCDDLVSDREEALSGDRMDKLYAAYLNQLKDRMLDGAKEVHVGTRWVPNDVIGRIVDENEGNERCRVIKIPALDEKGETNFDYSHGLGFSTGYYMSMRDSLTGAGEEDSWSAKYMCDPYYIGGLMFDPDHLKTYESLPDGEPDAVVAACDTKDRGADYAVLVVGKLFGGEWFIDDVVCDNGLPEAVEPKLAHCIVRNAVSMVQFESNGAGGRVADDTGASCARMGHVVDVRKKYSTENKETRILVDSLWIKEKCRFKHDPSNDDYRRFMSMLTHYSTQGKNKHDDAPDAMSMFKRFVSGAIKAKVEPMRRPF